MTAATAAAAAAANDDDAKDDGKMQVDELCRTADQSSCNAASVYVCMCMCVSTRK